MAASPPDGAKLAASQAITPPKDSPDCPSPADLACDAETAALKLRVQCLERDKTTLAARATDAETRAATAEVEKKNADTRATAAEKYAAARYIEKMHAMNETRTLKNDISIMDFELRDYGIKTRREIDGLKSRIQQLETEKVNRSFHNGSAAQLRAYEHLLAKLQSDFQACHAENVQLKEALKSSSDTIESLQDTVSQLQSDLTAEQAKTRTAGAGPTTEEIEARIDAAIPKANRNKNAELQFKFKALQQEAIAQANERGQEERTRLGEQYKESYRTQAQQVQKSLADEQQKTAALEQQLEAAKKEVELGKQKLRMAARTASSMHNNSPNKKRKLYEQGNARTVTPDRPRPRTHSLLSNGFARTPESITDSNDDTDMGGTQIHDGQAQNQRQKMTPRRIHMRQASQMSNGSGAPATPQRILQQQGPGFSTPPPQQNGMSPQQQLEMLLRQHLGNLTPEAQRQGIMQLAHAEINSLTPNRQQLLQEQWKSLPPMHQQTMHQRLAAQQLLRTQMQRANNGEMSAQSSSFQDQSMPQGTMNNGSPMRGMIAGSMQQTLRRPQIANGQQTFNSPQGRASMALQSPQVLQQQDQMQGQPQQSMHMPRQDQQIQEQMRQHLFKGSQMSMNGMQPMPQLGLPSSMLPPAFAMASPHIGQLGMPVNQSSATQTQPRTYTSFDAPLPRSVQHDEQYDQECASGEANATQASAMKEIEPISNWSEEDSETFFAPSVPQAETHSGEIAPAPMLAGSQLLFTENADDDFLSEDDPAMDLQGLSQMNETLAVASNGTPQMQNANFQQLQQDASHGTPQMHHVSFQHPKQRFQAHMTNPSQLHPGNPEGFNDGHHHHDGSFTLQMVPYGMKAHPNPKTSPFAQYAPASQFAPGSEMGTPASSRATPAPGGRARSRRLTPAPDTPVEPAQVPCVRCYKNWWENICGEGEPCDNCAKDNQPCKRLKCFNYAAGTCTKAMRGTCPNVHENEQRYHDEAFLTRQEKESVRLKRQGTQANKKVAPINRR